MVKTIKFLGNIDVAAEGKILWEILCQLRGLGVGRYITKTEWSLKWPDQPSYLRIVKARPKMDRWLHCGSVFAEWTFRGRNLGVYEFSHDLNRPDWKLVHKKDEAELCNIKNQMGEINLPDSIPLPPLHVYIAKQAALKNKKEWDSSKERAPMELCIDPQFEIYRDFIRQKPVKPGPSPYAEADPETFLDWYGRILPVKAMPFNSDPPTKLILVTGSVISGVGKGVITSSLGVLMRSRGYRISVIKIDPYINVDAGTFSPYEHGEVFVLDDGGEVDLDFGNYERFLNLRLQRDNNITTGKIYDRVIRRERDGFYLGKTVQSVPHITDAIVEWVESVSKIPVDGSDKTPDVCIIELGGTVGDIEGQIFQKAFGDRFCNPKQRNNFMNVHVSMLVGTSSEPQKTKPMQEGIAKVRHCGLSPDLLMVRSELGIDNEMRQKIAGFSQLLAEQVVDAKTMKSTFEVPLYLETQQVTDFIIDRLDLRSSVEPQPTGAPTLKQWQTIVNCTSNQKQTVHIALVGKYVDSRDAHTKDAYKSVIESLGHAGIFCKTKVQIKSIDSGMLEDIPNMENKAELEKRIKMRDEAWNLLKRCDGILVPGGFGDRGTEGMMLACQYARENKVPYFGICLGMQCAAIEFARNVCHLKNANSTEFDAHLDDTQRVVIDMPEHATKHQGAGASMRLGRRTTFFLKEDSVLRKIYRILLGTDVEVEERHRHRYEVNPLIVPSLVEKGLHFVGLGIDEVKREGHRLPATPSSANLEQLALNDENSSTLSSHDQQYFAKIKTLCENGGDGITAAPIRMEILELEDHPYFVGVQYHPEYLSSPFCPSAPFLGLVLASGSRLEQFLNGNLESEIKNLHESIVEQTLETTKLRENFVYGAKPLNAIL